MVRPKRDRQHPDLQAAIKETAREQIAASGAAALSLRAIALKLGITAPAIYNYFPRRDDLVTALIVDAYNSLAAVLAASQETGEESHVERIMALAHAYRDWTLAHSEEYSLIFGTPIPNYHAPMEITGPAAAGGMAVLIGALDAAWRDGALKAEGVLSATSEMVQAWINKLGYKGPPAVIHLTMAIWAQIHGLLSLELFGHLTAVPEQVDVEAFFNVEIQAIVARMGIE